MRVTGSAGVNFAGGRDANSRAQGWCDGLYVAGHVEFVSRRGIDIDRVRDQSRVELSQPSIITARDKSVLVVMPINSMSSFRRTRFGESPYELPPRIVKMSGGPGADEHSIH